MSDRNKTELFEGDTVFVFVPHTMILRKAYVSRVIRSYGEETAIYEVEYPNHSIHNQYFQSGQYLEKFPPNKQELESKLCLYMLEGYQFFDKY